MKLNLTRPLIVFDLETTGLDVAADRITQISYIKVLPDGAEARESLYVNPGVPIPPEVTKLTGITDEQVAAAPAFKDLAPRLAAAFKGCDFAGYNSNHFDIPLLCEEFLRAGVPFDFGKCRLVDVQTIYFKHEPRNLAAAYKFFCGRKMEDDFEAHRADQDTEATYRVLQAMLDKYSPDNEPEPERQVLNDVAQLAKISVQGNNVDFAGRFVWKDLTDQQGNPVKDAEGNTRRYEAFNFGTHKGKSVAEVLRTFPNYYDWMMKGTFPADTKQVLTRIRLRELSK